MSDFIKSFLGILLVAALSCFFGIRYGRKTAPENIKFETICDTTTIYDTVFIDKPVYKYSYLYDTIRTYFTTIEHDTVQVDLPIERKVYAEDSLYRAVVSGYKPNLDSLWVYPTVTTITIHEKEKIPAPKFSLGVTAGPSALVTPTGGIHAGFGITAGLQYRF